MSPSLAVTVSDNTTSNTPSPNLELRVSRSNLTSGFHSCWKIAGELGHSKDTSLMKMRWILNSCWLADSDISKFQYFIVLN